ncbi:MAG: hypothetical protein ACKE9I_04495 [Methylophagaceae bacterium]
MHTSPTITMVFLASTVISLLTVSTVQAEQTLSNALTSGKVSFSAQARHETVVQDNALKDAEAFTLRTTLSYKTGAFHGFSAFAEIEDVANLGSENYNSLSNDETAYSIIAEPDSTEVNQAYLQYNGFNTELKFGRQEIARKALLYRFTDNSLWTQHHTSYDAFSLRNTSFADTTFRYIFLTKIHTLYGDDRNVRFIKNGDIDIDVHLVYLRYSGLAIGKLMAYGSFSDYHDAKALSSKKLSLRLKGSQIVNKDVSVIYSAAISNQAAYKGSTRKAKNYYFAEFGVKYKDWLAKVSYELQEGDGTDRYKRTRRAAHLHQGWADQFLTTPLEGLEDLYFTVIGKVFGAKLVAVYHNFETDEGNLDAGKELDLLLVKTFKQHYTLGMKYADYNAGSEFAGVDTKKIWVFGQVKF